MAIVVPCCHSSDRVSTCPSFSHQQQKTPPASRCAQIAFRIAFISSRVAGRRTVSLLETSQCHARELVRPRRPSRPFPPTSPLAHATHPSYTPPSLRSSLRTFHQHTSIRPLACPLAVQRAQSAKTRRVDNDSSRSRKSIGQNSFARIIISRSRASASPEPALLLTLQENQHTNRKNVRLRG